MIKKITGSFLLAFHNIRSHFFHTMLSILGIVIGVAALVAILSLIDGLEKFAKDQIRQTSSLNAVMVYSESFKWINHVRVRKDSIPVITYDQLASLKSGLKHPAELYLQNGQAGEIRIVGDTAVIGTIVKGSNEFLLPGQKADAGILFQSSDLTGKKDHAIVNSAFAQAINKKSPELIGKLAVFKSDTLRIIGVLQDTLNKTPNLFLPITRLRDEEFQTMPPGLALEASTFEDVNLIKDEVKEWIKKAFPKHQVSDFSIVTNEFRLKQAEQGFLLFRVIMGLIVGISVLVGGIGVMNVLLISVTQRTVEIGVRKAVGAKKRDLILQFLSEAITVSSFGSFIGLIAGVGFSMAVVPLIRLFVEIPFEASYTWNTFFLISIIAVVVGIVFGTYPAIRASRLDPVEAIRRE